MTNIPRDGYVHLLHSSLAASDQQLQSLRELLNEKEQARADRIRIERPRRQFIVARAMLRCLLGRYIDQPAKDVHLTFGQRGKPSLADTQLHFNLSHSHERVIYAFTQHNEIGVDIEQLRDKVRYEDLAKRYFSPGEVQSLMALPDHERHRGFFRCWTRKEAIIKAKGTGLSLPLNQFEVAFAPGQVPALLRTDWDPTEAAQWWLYNLNLDDHYAGALAVRGEPVQIESFQIDVKICVG
jgi:4'-phosphopantetheinyl transferase